MQISQLVSERDIPLRVRQLIQAFNQIEQAGLPGVGYVVGPASATDSAIARWDGTSGALLKDSGILIDASNNIAGINDLSAITGDFSVGVTSPFFTGDLIGTASLALQAAALQTARTIWGQSFDGTADVLGAFSGATTGDFSGAVTAPSFIGDLAGNADTVTNGVYTTGSYVDPAWLASLAWGKITGTPTTIAGYGITDFNSLGDARWTQHDGTGATGTWAISISGSSGSTTGNAATATALLNTRTIWGQNFNGTANVSGALSGATTGAFSTSVSTPIVSNSGTLQLNALGANIITMATNGVVRLTIASSGSAVFTSFVDATQFRAPILDSGSATDLILERNNVVKVTIGDSLVTFATPITISSGSGTRFTATGTSADLAILNRDSSASTLRILSFQRSGTTMYGWGLNPSDHAALVDSGGVQRFNIDPANGNVSVLGTLSVAGRTTLYAPASTILNLRASDGTVNQREWSFRIDGTTGALDLRSVLDNNTTVQAIYSINHTTGVITFSQTISGSITGSSGSTTGNAATATALQNTRTIWGQNFDGTANVIGALTGVTTIGMSGLLTFTTTNANSIMVTRTSSATNSSIAFGTTSGTVYIGQGAANTFAIRDTADLADVPWFTVSSSAVTASLFVGDLQGTADEALLADVALLANEATILETTRTIWGQSFNGSANVSGALSSVTTGAFSSNVTVGGTLGATGVLTASGGVVGNLTGNASTATTLQTSRTIWGQSFNGSANVQGSIDLTQDGNSTIRGTLEGTNFHEAVTLAVNLKYGGSGNIETASNWTYINAAGANNNAGHVLLMKGNGTESGQWAKWNFAPLSTGAAAALTSWTNVMTMTVAGVTFLSATISNGLTVTAGGASLGGGASIGGSVTVTTGDLTMSAGRILTTASASGGSGFRLPHGAAPSAPVNGDLWTTTSGLFARINGATVGPFATSSGSGDVVGPGSATDDAIATFDGATGKLIQNSTATIIGNILKLNGSAELLHLNDNVSGSDAAMTSWLAFQRAGTNKGWLGYTAASSGLMNLANTIGAISIITTASASITLSTNGTTRLTISGAGVATIADLAGVGTRVVGANASGDLVITTAGSGDVVGPGSATDNAIARFNGTGGKTIQNSSVIIDDSNNITGVVNLTSTGIIRSGASGFNVNGTPGVSAGPLNAADYSLTFVGGILTDATFIA
jgi:hypothetical protein